MRMLAQTWLLLVCATLLGAWLGEAGVHHGEHRPWLAAAVIVIAFAKAWVVGIRFMQLQTAPRVLRLLFEGWIVGAATAMIFLLLG
jgi:hypothetical protein